ncbi:MAG: DNA double-strand break repair Rad50 ATPase [Candidatus Methanofastidiosum methylothiophilum]|uniref:DNA double-strand break repair Rad50 ATPase n=1 Tax=Candidatus Methanofastidiosum methylothiophilum TaxID=1705564 RepID=A0A150ITY5_9EURY|nr:MAG: DNA double-strand break repair Rad50 ATPase [Candidatus Methanofastidiosum methylthiophilus]KYC48114.1 MAG: DNA double-strand break repair Rad50 ATPase [Candidatus Methanofastidiosum methylthiophilus]KYC50647.1 MAG: DNA double-strand break repair Rad50 ATPase [Candidatus Methanofastidiosum methylthiophilus]
MKLLALEMLNIRSYQHQRVEFPEGSFLLSGDIGFGKSTILLAIEFALFGLGDIVASSLLRRGEREGMVRLEFDLDGREIIVGRSLQKKGETISQTIGYISVDGNRREMTPTEIKAEILSLLGYPKELFSKQKNPIYRYTVYTPQEEMKQILLSKREDRMEILRRIFGVDRYKTIRDNSNNLRLDLKRKAGSYEILSKGINEKNQELKTISERKEILSKEVTEINKSLDSVRANETSIIKKSEEIEEKFKQFQIISREISGKDAELKTYEESLSKLQQKLKQLLGEKDKIDLEKEIISIENDTKKILEHLSKSKEKKDKLNEHKILSGKLETDISNKKESIEKINKEIKLKKDALSNLKKTYNKTPDEIRNEISLIQKNIEYIYQRKEGINKQIDGLLNSKERYNTKISEYKEQNSIAMGRLRSIESDLLSLSNLEGGALCPLCKQNISEEHKKSEINRIENERNSLTISLNQTKELINKVVSKIANIDKEIEKKSNELITSEKNKIKELDELIKETESFNLLSKELDSLSSERLLIEQEIKIKLKEQKQNFVEIEKLAPVEIEISELETRKESNLELNRKYREALGIKKEIEEKINKKISLERDINNLNVNIKIYLGIDSEKNQINQQLRIITEEKIKKEREEAEKSKELELLERDVCRIKAEIEEKKKYIQVKQKLDNISNWLDNYFISLMETMEKEFMESLRLQFESYFSKWLENLLEGNEIEASIDEDFTPILRQEGFDADYESLSGGERTSVALAYRLALNRVINNLVDEIKTQDIIILDEPTDGFSRKQLDRVRDVLDMLGMNQVIIVSHEPEIESYVDHVLRITKRDGVSRVESQASFSRTTVGL